MKANISNEECVEKFCNYWSPSCDEEGTFRGIGKNTETTRITANKAVPEDRTSSDDPELCCVACRAPIRSCNGVSCDDARMYWGINKGGRWVPIEGTSPEVVLSPLPPRQVIEMAALGAEQSLDLSLAGRLPRIIPQSVSARSLHALSRLSKQIVV